MTLPSTEDVVDLLMAQHRQIESLLAQLKSGQGDKSVLFKELVRLLATGFTKAIGPAAATFVDPEAYRAAALLGHTTGHCGVAPHIEWTGAGLMLGLLSTVLAVLMALATLHVGTLRARGKPPLRSVAATVTALHRLHSGHVGDYAAWLVFGAAAIAGLVATGWL